MTATKNASDLRVRLREEVATLAQENATLRKALARTVPWLGKLIADGGHRNCVLPRDAEIALDQAEAALAGRKGKA